MTYNKRNIFCEQKDCYKQMDDFIEQNELAKFSSLLLRGADPNYSNGVLPSIYEKLLSTPQRAEFLKLCIDRGCDVSYENKHLQKAAINYAVESKHFSNLLVLFNSTKKKIKNVNQEYQQQTPLNYLAKELNKANAGEIRECMELLLQNGASIGLKDGDDLAPLNYVMSNTEILSNDKYELIYMLLLRYTCRDDVANAAWTYIETDHWQTHLVLKRKTRDQMITERPFQSYPIALLDKYNKHKDENALKVLFQTLNINTVDDNMEILRKVMSYKNITVFEQILSAKNFNLDPLKVIELAKFIIAEMPDDARDERNFYKEYLTLLGQSRHVDVNDVDKDGTPLICYAANEKNETAVKMLLDQGAYLGMRSDYKKKPMANIRPELVEQHFDNCITMDGKSRYKKINIDLKNICHPPKRSTMKIAHNDMATITQIKKSKDLQHLLTHPVVTAFLNSKWQLYSKYFYIHYVIYCIFQILITTYIIAKFGNNTHEINALPFLCLTFILYLMICEIVQILLGLLHYVKSGFTNFMDLLTIVLSTLTCLAIGTKEFQNICATYTLLFTFFKLFLLMRSLPIQLISMPLLMLFEVIKTVLKSIILIAIVAVFGLCFHIRLGANQTNVLSTNSTETSSMNFNTFITSFIKSMIMSTGEYDASNLLLTHILDQLLLFLFVIVAGTSLFNLLTGMAVNDIKMIKDQAEIIRAIDRIDILNTCEEFLNHPWWNRLISNIKWLNKPSDKPVQKITISKYRYPYEMNCHYYPYAPIETPNSTKIDCDEVENKPNKSVKMAKHVKYSQLPADNKDTPSLNKSNDQAERPPPSSSFGHIKKSCKKLFSIFTITELWSNVFCLQRNLIDTKTVQRAVRIAEQKSNKTPEVYIEQLKHIIRQNQKIIEAFQMATNNR